MSTNPDGFNVKKAIEIHRLHRDCSECLKRIRWLIDVFEASVFVGDWYRAMICSYRIKTSLYCYNKILKKMGEV